ncbi:MAG: 30S ribosome-binding factor RbfA [Rikenellaceae bacterium]|nr:30S ribosome-binding factor RbfA [Rikenellaceae bacterium]
METTRQQKVGRQIQKDISEIFLREAAGIFPGAMVTVTLVRMTPDLGIARIYMSVFPFARKDEVLGAARGNTGLIRKALGARVRNQLKLVPELEFYIDDSLEYIDNIDNLLK